MYFQVTKTRIPIPSISREQMIEVDRLMINRFKIELPQMMEIAGYHLAELTMGIIGDRTQPVLVLAGSGHNGGGGMVAARHLANRDLQVHVVLTGTLEHVKPVTAQRWETLQYLPTVTIEHFDSINGADYSSFFVIDAMVGYGLTGKPKTELGKMIQWVNRLNTQVLALDAPSGLDVTNGIIKTDNCVKAEATMTLALPKIALTTNRTKKVVGDLYLADIGVPNALYKSMGIDVGNIFSESSIIRL